MTKALNCPLCKSSKVSLFHNKVWSTEKGAVYKCKNCDVAFIWPVYSEKEMKAFYRNYNKHLEKRGVTVKGIPAELHEKSRIIAKERYERVRQHFKGRKTVLEIGSATGAFLELLQDKNCFCVEAADDNREFSKKFSEKAYSDILEISVPKALPLFASAGLTNNNRYSEI